jgi:hypothetical protein
MQICRTKGAEIDGSEEDNKQRMYTMLQKSACIFISKKIAH